MPKNFYAVYNGHKPGIYDSWSEAEKQVKKFPKAVFKKFPTKPEAEQYMKTCEKNDTKSSSDRLVIFTDGSYLNHKAGAGVYFPENKKGYSFLYTDKSTISCAELFAVKKALELTSSEENKSLLIYSDSLYTINILTGRNTAHENRELYEEIMKLIQGRDVKFEHCDSHSGIYGNDMADFFAKKGTEL